MTPGDDEALLEEVLDEGEVVGCFCPMEIDIDAIEPEESPLLAVLGQLIQVDRWLRKKTGVDWELRRDWTKINKAVTDDIIPVLGERRTKTSFAPIMDSVTRVDMWLLRNIPDGDDVARAWKELRDAIRVAR